MHRRDGRVISSSWKRSHTHRDHSMSLIWRWTFTGVGLDGRHSTVLTPQEREQHTSKEQASEIKFYREISGVFTLRINYIRVAVRIYQVSTANVWSKLPLIQFKIILIWTYFKWRKIGNLHKNNPTNVYCYLQWMMTHSSTHTWLDWTWRKSAVLCLSKVGIAFALVNSNGGLRRLKLLEKMGFFNFPNKAQRQ